MKLSRHLNGSMTCLIDFFFVNDYGAHFKRFKIFPNQFFIKINCDDPEIFKANLPLILIMVIMMIIIMVMMKNKWSQIGPKGHESKAEKLAVKVIVSQPY